MQLSAIGHIGKCARAESRGSAPWFMQLLPAALAGETHLCTIYYCWECDAFQVERGAKEFPPMKDLLGLGGIL